MDMYIGLTVIILFLATAMYFAWGCGDE